MPTERNVARLWTPRVSPRHKHKFHGGGVFPQGKFLKQFFTGKETRGTPVVAAAATSINFTNGRGDSFFYEDEIRDTLGCKRPQLRG